MRNVQARIQAISATASSSATTAIFSNASGAFFTSGTSNYMAGLLTRSSDLNTELGLNSSRTAPTGSRTAPRAWCSLTCVYLGS